MDSLLVAQDNFGQFKACNAQHLGNVRSPALGEDRPADWKGLREQRLKAQQELFAEIGAAFGGVRREGGVSLHQMDVIDDYGDAKAMEKAEKLDPETHWQDIADEKLIDPRIGQSLVFLDAKGFRFYIPAYMMFVLRHWESSSVSGFWFSLRGDEFYQKCHYMLLSTAQKQVVARFLSTMRELGESEAQLEAADCLVSYWHAYASTAQDFV